VAEADADAPGRGAWQEAPLPRLFVLSAVSLYFELLVVRWTTAYVTNVAFFTNFLVLASFVGLGAGFLLASVRARLVALFPPAVLVFAALVDSARPRHVLEHEAGAAAWGGAPGLHDNLLSSPEAFIAVTFVVVAALFVLLGQPIGEALSRVPPLRGYAVNIAGSLLGIVLFAAGSFVLASPIVWFALVLGALAPFVWEARRVVAAGASLAAVALLVLVASMNEGSIWSPYTRAEVFPRPDGEYGLAGNGAVGIELLHFRKRLNLFTAVHGEGGLVKPRRYADVLVVGAGGGNDVNVALHYGAESVDAVEINPLAIELGKKLHPEQPYASPKVRVFVDDGRAFLRSTDKKYDLVVYALPESPTGTGASANMRTESYLATVEAFRAVRQHLKPDGVFAVYNFYRERWLVRKLATTLEQAFERPPLVLLFDGPYVPAVLIAGPGVAQIRTTDREPTFDRSVPATDDWPFLYLTSPHVPAIYLRSLGIVGAASLLFICALAWIGRPAGAGPREAFAVDGPMFFMGAAFMLLEAKSIVTFGLLFGTTWLTTALVIAGLLAMVLAAVFATQRLGDRWGMSPWAAGLVGALVLVYVVPPETMVLASPVLRYVVAAACTLSPVLFANVIFARLLGESRETARSLASNLLGSLVGGLAEYASLALGYRRLLPIVGVMYGLAFLLVWRRRAAPAPSVSAELV
jgi:SAM-dependent methyltransferase